MPRRPAKVTQADISRAIRAAKEAGAVEVSVDSNGVIRIALTASAPATSTQALQDGWIPSEALRRYVETTETG